MLKSCYVEIQLLPQVREQFDNAVLKSTLTFLFERKIDSSPINGLNYNVCLTCTE